MKIETLHQTNTALGEVRYVRTNAGSKPYALIVEKHGEPVRLTRYSILPEAAAAYATAAGEISPLDPHLGPLELSTDSKEVQA